jgi:hypothetical protein
MTLLSFSVVTIQRTQISFPLLHKDLKSHVLAPLAPQQERVQVQTWLVAFRAGDP